MTATVKSCGCGLMRWSRWVSSGWWLGRWWGDQRHGDAPGEDWHRQFSEYWRRAGHDRSPKKATIVIGANNSGKSNILAAMTLFRDAAEYFHRLRDEDRHLRDENALPLIVADLEIRPGSFFPDKSPGDIVRFICVYDRGHSRWSNTPFDSMDRVKLRHYHQSELPGRTASQIGDDALEIMKTELSERAFEPQIRSLPKAVFIPQHRQIEKADKYEIQGAGIVALLNSWQHPDIGHDKDSEKFQEVQNLLRGLLHLPTVELEIAHDKSKIIVKRDQLRLPLSHYGTGIHQLIILAIAVLAHSNTIVCIEEPETNLHPALQRELLRFLLEKTSNKYIISTHSHALIEPNEDVDVVHVTLRGKVTIPRVIQTTKDTLNLLRDLGVRASDILQANAAIWVEGPSDRVYLKRWLEILAPALLENIHYSIMFYSGRLLSHLSLNREDGPTSHDFIQLLRINQHSAIVIDSDRRRPDDLLNESKLRIQKEAGSEEIYCWVTDGREIENYLGPEVIEAAYRNIIDSSSPLSFGLYDSLEEKLKATFQESWAPKYSYDGHKPTRAREIATHLQEHHIGNKLKEHLNALIQLIRGASELNHDEP
ncbi:MAG: AAA family ATPase [Thermoanaerobaculia bacterium]|nr:AAA family ATPase [Thermoanaerobaculia bacterium]